MPPVSLSHYRIDSELGRGGIGVLYRAFDQRLHRSVAIKVLANAVAADPLRRTSILDEARMYFKTLMTTRRFSASRQPRGARVSAIKSSSAAARRDQPFHARPHPTRLIGRSRMFRVRYALTVLILVLPVALSRAQ